jgi:phosphate transport system permease protein
MTPDSTSSNQTYPPGLEPVVSNLPARHRLGKIWRAIFVASTVFGMFILAILLVDIANNSFGYAALTSKVMPASLTTDGKPLEAASQEELIAILESHLRVSRLNTLEKEKPLAARTQNELYKLVIVEVVQPKVIAVWGLYDSIFRKGEIPVAATEIAIQKNVDPSTVAIVFMTWLDREFLTSPQSSDALYAGIRTAFLGSLWVILITISFAFPVGIGAAIYLQEYARDNAINRLIQTNINNLAGVPSIIYGMLGLTIFVRLLAPITSGAIFGFPNADPHNGRTIISAGLTMALLILPVIIITGQEAIKAVPNSLREAAYGIGATKWQTVWHHVLPNAIPGILTGTIISVSRAIGETAPLVIIGASTYIAFDPDGLFSKFTTLPIQIYQWTSRPQDEFRAIAAAAIIALLALLLALNAVAILLRNRFSRRL